MRTSSLLLLVPLISSCESTVTVKGRAFATRDGKEAGIGLVSADEQLLEHGPEIWPLGKVRIACPETYEADEDGFFEAECAQRDIYVTPVWIHLEFSREGYRTEGRTYWMTGVDEGRVVAVLLKREVAPP